MNDKKREKNFMGKLLKRTRRISQGQAFEKWNMHIDGPKLEYFSQLVCGKESFVVVVLWEYTILRARESF